MTRLSPIDAAFLRMESKRTPMHVGAMMTFKLPDDAPADFCQRLVQQMRSQPFMPDPFSSRLAHGRFGRRLPVWEDSEVDMEYHLRHSALPFPGGEKELGVLVARMHSHPLDLSRPLWECHVIEGLEGRRFALYFKAHHCAIDGVGAMRMVQNWLSRDPADRSGVGPWTVLARKRTERGTPTLRERVATPARAAATQVRGLQDLVRNLTAMMQGDDSSVRLALQVPRSLFNQRISQQRRLGTQILSLSRLRAIAEAEGVTVNDVLLAVVGGAFRRYLTEQDALPERSLIASVPMGLARADGSAGTAAVGFITPLGTELDDPAERLRWIHRVTARGKHDLSSMPAAAQSQFALLGIAPLLLGQVTGVLPKLPPLFNCVVSNVVLSKDPLYLMGAELEAMYPVSFLFDGYALNVTLVGYRDAVAVGFLGCRDAIPSLQKLAIYSGEALSELEAAVGLAPRKPAAKRRTGSRRRAS
ncbi:WS/DGAT/MGAT family O-acyltransferase [Sinimarinibacterium flocculans]|uniref:WS/DGAT/MGAT family O-acyltransferase n=1 Tax=Sinimarinibacterium flocculans TaxID=985250 RepID=UPI0024937E94|nr:wax ester/triacylglycerol synthase family O-acyltransferase [Sinimarinibacterium flocculans]